jgi:hypothetical protein
LYKGVSKQWFMNRPRAYFITTGMSSDGAYPDLDGHIVD